MHFYLAQWILARLQDWNTHDGTSRHKPSTEITHLGLATFRIHLVQACCQHFTSILEEVYSCLLNSERIRFSLCWILSQSTCFPLVCPVSTWYTAGSKMPFQSQRNIFLSKSLEKPTQQDHIPEHHVYLVICKTHELRYLFDDVRVAVDYL